MKRRSEQPLALLGSDLSGLPNEHGFVAQAVAATFEFLNIGATLLDGAGEWHSLHTDASSINGFELGHGLGVERGAYNSRCLERAHSERQSVLGTHAGFSDFFVPVSPKSGRLAFLISGPFATERATSADVLERWRGLSGRHGHPSDPEFAHYLSSTLATLTLEGEQLSRYQRWLECFALLIAGRGDAHEVASEAARLSAKLEQARFAEKMWTNARTMVDERTAQHWQSAQKGDDLLRVGQTRVPEHLVVGLLQRPRGDGDPVDDLIRRDAFQRACVDLALSTHSVCGRVGEHGVVFLQPGLRSKSRLVAEIRELAASAATLARRQFGFTLHVGTSPLDRSQPLSEGYELALGAAERALFEGLSLQHAESAARPTTSPLRELRRKLVAGAESLPDTLPARFDRYAEAIGIYSGYRLELCQVHFETGFDQLAQALLETGAVSEKSYLEACEGVLRAARDAGTLSELSLTYRRAVVALVDLALRPVQATQDQNLRRAMAFIQEHASETLSLAQVARVAGFSPNYFSQLFKQRAKVTFENYVQQLRVERAKNLLATTDLSAERVSQLCGFRLRHYFHRVFKNLVGMTPAKYRSSRPVSRRRVPERRRHKFEDLALSRRR